MSNDTQRDEPPTVKEKLNALGREIHAIGRRCSKCGHDPQPDPAQRDELNPNIDGLVSNCARCGQRVPFDYNIDDNWWNQTVPDEMRRDVLCLPCLEWIADGVPLHLIRVVYYTGNRGTLTLIPLDRIPTRKPPQRDELRCSCQVEAKNMIRHGREFYIRHACSCMDHQPDKRCDCPFCILVRAGKIGHHHS